MATSTEFDEPPAGMQKKMDKRGYKYAGMRDGQRYSARDPTTGGLVWVSPLGGGKYRAKPEKDANKIAQMKKQEDAYRVGWKGRFFKPGELEKRVSRAHLETDEAMSLEPLIPIPATRPMSHAEKVAKIMAARARTGRDIPIPVDPRSIPTIGPTTPKKKTGHTTFAHGTPTHTIPVPAFATSPAAIALPAFEASPAAESDVSSVYEENVPAEVELGETTLERLALMQEEAYRNWREGSSKSLAGSIAGTRAPSRPDPDRNISVWRRARIRTAGYQQQRPSVTWKINEIARRNLSFRELLGWMPRYQAMYR